MSDTWSTICVAMTRFWFRSLLGYVFAIAYGRHGVHHATAAQSQYLDDAIWLANMTCSLCDHLLRSTAFSVDMSTAVMARCLATMEDFVSGVTRVSQQIKCPSSLSALPPAWTRALWITVVIFACCWVPCVTQLRPTAFDVRKKVLGMEAIDGLSKRAWSYGRKSS